MNARLQSIDKTYLSIDTAEERGFIHRDYIAHCMRHSHVIKRMGERKAYASARLLDVGCGRELPLAKLLYSSRYVVDQYYGVDVGPINDSAVESFSSGKFPIKVWERTNVLDVSEEDLGIINWATMFEVAEHVEPKMLIDMLVHIRKHLSTDGIFFVSTPCWNRRDCAANHVNEMTYEAFGAVLEGCGWKIRSVHGTFASIRDYEQDLVGWFRNGMNGPPMDLRNVFNALREYYDTNFLSCVFAPLFPAQSRNCLWELTPLTENESPTKMRPRKLKFKPLELCERPWGSSERWEDMAQLPLL